MTDGAGRLGEFERIDRYFAPLAAGAPGALGLGDDAALLPELDAGQAWVVTADSLVAGIHYLPDDPADLVARKALRTNLSDLAAMGAVPVAYTLALALRKRADGIEVWIERFANGLAVDQEEFDIDLIGGDSVSTDGPVTIAITAFGRVTRGGELRRSGAGVGDDVWVSGTIGDGALGLMVATGGILRDAVTEALLDRYRLPQPRTALGPLLSGVATAAMDVSDGLIQDAGHLARRSGLALRLHAPEVPLSDAAKACIDSDPGLMHDALVGGDDYELLFTAPGMARDAVVAAAQASGVPVTRIGEAVSGSGVTVLDRHGRALDGLEAGGWQHA